MYRFNDHTLLSHQVGGCEVIMHPHKALFIPASEILVCSDLHVGKGGHFRRNGIAIPAMVNKGNFWRLVDLFELFLPKSVLFLGDLMHSTANREWDDFLDMLDQYSGVRRLLVRGNHELYGDNFYEAGGFDIRQEWIVDGIRFVHEPPQVPGPENYVLSGHIHPAVAFKGQGRQRLSLPCFWFSDQQGILPAFGEFTGQAIVRPRRGDAVFVSTGKEVCAVS